MRAVIRGCSVMEFFMPKNKKVQKFTSYNSVYEVQEKMRK